MLMKKTTLLFGLFLVLLLAACGANGTGDSETSDSTDSAQTADPTEEATENDATQTVTDGKDREVTIPKNPESVVALTEIGEVMGLGVQPTASIGYYLDKFNPEKVEGIENVGQDQANLEQLVALAPDLIIIPSYMEPTQVDSLEKIAPTYATKFKSTPLERMEGLATILDKQDEFAQWKEEYATKVEETKEAIAPYVEEGDSALVVQFYDKLIYQHAPTVFSALYDNGVGFQVPEGAEAITDTQSISEEVVADYAANTDFLFILTQNPEDNDRYQQLIDTVWADIPAVQNGKAFLVPNERWNDYSISGMQWTLEDLPKVLAGEKVE
ncbi:iron complex transport system substrate-binding protein [Aureibacillus halotolerans]|uniref:Iron complex transport system substrate-binding protein n=2 Tax=Aureibacillus halotolerans TaxID=1508390 RepID=A0A4R6U374_9BACI|nr:iron complex transport system substrate-binding protein [Aureibacillus halotolerans]